MTGLRPGSESKAVKIGKRITFAFLAVHAVLWPLSGYRAWVQVYDVNLRAGPAVAAGSKLVADVTTSGRITIEVEMILDQDSVSKSLGTHFIPSNREPMYDPRPRHDSLVVTLDKSELSSFHAGKANLRAVATGRPQFTRMPPPVMSELAVHIAP